MKNRRELTEKIIRLSYVKDEKEIVKKINELLLDAVNDVQGFLNPISDLEAPLLCAVLRFVSEMMAEKLDEEASQVADNYYHLMKDIFRCERKEIATINVAVMGKGCIHGI